MKKKYIFLFAFLLNSFILSAQVVTYTYTGAMQTYTVPPGVTSIQIECWGAQGGSYTGAGAPGLGGYAQGVLAVTPGQTLNIYVGGQGVATGNSSPCPGGWNGGGSTAIGFDPGSGGVYTGSGGGASDVRSGGTALANRVIVGGGGGGGCRTVNNYGNSAGGNGGGLIGGNGVNTTFGTYTAGGGGTQSAGGTAGNSTSYTTPGSLGQGGINTATTGGWSGGGGGGGYYGGGGGGALGCGGGGGSSYTGGVTTGSTTAGIRSGDGQVVITPLSVAVPDINIKGNSVTIVDGDVTPSTADHTSFGSVSTCNGTITRTFTIENTGTAPLTISSVNITGTNASDFTLSSSPASSVAASGTTTFQITFNPSANGVRTATITVNSNDADEAAYDFAIDGTGDADLIAPVPNITNLPTANGNCNTTVTAPTATDNCAGAVTATTSDPTSYATEGSYTITWTYNDGNGNTTTQTQSVIVDDNTAPVPNVGALPAVNGSCNATVPTPMATDNCAGAITATTSDPVSYSTEGTYTITWTYNDGNGNTTTQTQSVIVNDNAAPVPNVGALPAIHGQCFASVPTPSATDNCAGNVNAVTSDPTSYSSEGTYTITWTYNDGNGNTTTQTQSVIVNDTIAPVPNVPVLPNAVGNCSVTLTAPTANDNCSGTIAATTNSPLNYNTQGSYTVIWMYSDGNGNNTMQTQTVVVTDNVAPVPQLSSLPAINAQCSATVAAPLATDNCSGTVTATTSDPTTYNTTGNYTITWVYDDGNGNSTTQTQSITINDATPPVPNIASLPAIVENCSAIVTIPAATDNCSGTVTATTSDPLSYSSVGTYSVTWTYSDASGNTTTQTQQVVVNDHSDPIPVNADIDTNAICNLTLTPPTALDDCQGLITGTTASPTTYGPGNYMVVWSYDDGNGNTSSQVQNITVSGCAGIDEENNITVSVYPNPGDGILQVQLSNMIQEEIQVRLISVLGEALYTGVMQNNNQTFDFSYLASGTYYLQLVLNNNLVTKQVIIR